MNDRPMNETDSIFGPGLGESQRTILELLLRSGEATLADLAMSVDLATETVRDHLKALAAKGLVERAGVRREGPGRPHVRYRLSKAGVSLFPRREGELLRELAAFLQDTGNADLLESFFEARVRRKREVHSRRLAHLEGVDRIEEVARILSEEGFMAEIENSSGKPSLRLCHCPLREVVAVSHLPCRAEMTLVRELLGESLCRVSFMPEGDSTCTYSIGETGAPSDGLEAADQSSTN